jgi:hypothetical protein
MRRSPTVPASRIALSLAVLALAAGCSTADPPPSERTVHEVNGTVQAWLGDAKAPAGQRLTVERFNDDVGARAGSETRALITSAEAYQDYFGHPAPAGVSVGKEWVVFYAAGKAPGGSTPDVSLASVDGDILTVVTTLTGPIPPCLPPVPGTAAGSGTTGSGGAPAATPSQPTTVAPAPAASTPPAPPAGKVGPSYVLVKFPAQQTHAVEFQHQEINPGCGGPQPPRCRATSDCSKSERCSTERGDCQSCGGAPGTVCPAVCFGVCEPIPVPPPTNPCAAILCPAGSTCVVLDSYPPQARCVTPPDRCTSTASCPKGSRCSTERGDCQGCGGGPNTVCPAVCFGICEPEPSGVCTGGELMGGCRSEAEIKADAAAICKKANLQLTDFAVGNACFASGFAIAKYSCCSVPTPPPPPAPTCKADSDCHLTYGGCGQKPCTCYAVATGQPQPACAPEPVECLVDPCAQKQAACVSGQCAVQLALKR